MKDSGFIATHNMFVKVVSVDLTVFDRPVNGGGSEVHRKSPFSEPP